MTLGPGDRLGRYEILAPLGAGGMGEVYRARDDRLDREVAIKVMPEGVAQDPERLSRFEREAKAVASLSHPNILEIFDFGTDGEITYAVAELLEGQSLREWVTRGLGDWRSALTICAAIADGLAAAHKSQIIHRDLKPENVFLTDDDQVKILDFGLAKILHAEAATGLRDEAPTASMGTDPGSVMGTAGYMSPEQVRGEPVDHRTDIFALGCLLHELLCGRRAFPGNSAAEIATGILTRPSTPLQQAGCDLPVDVQPIVDRCLEKSPANRFQDSGDLSFALRSLTTGSGSGDPPPAPRLRRGWRWMVAAGIVVAAVAGAVYLRDRPTTEVPVETTTGLNPNLVAVAPFENRTGNAELDDLGLVTADWLTNTLARIDAIDVVPIGLGVESRAGVTSPLEVADATGAGIVVTGSYSLDGDTLRFQTNLTDAIQGSLLRSIQPTTGPVDQPMACVESLASEVAGAVASLFAAWDRAFDQNFQAPSFEAYREYTAGLEYFAVDNRKAFEHWNRATEIDPGFVSPQLMMVSLLKAVGKFAEAQAVVDSVSEQRQRMNPFERVWLEYHTAMLDGDSQRALAQMRLSIEMAPRSTLIRFGLTRNLLLCARPHEALAVISEIDDLDHWAGYGPCSFLYNLKVNAEHVIGLFEDELTTANQGMDVCGNEVRFQIARARAQIGMGAVERVEDAVNEGLKASDARSRSPRLFSVVARELDAHGHPVLALELAERGVIELQEYLDSGEAAEWGRIRYAQLLVMIGRLDEANQVLLALNDEIPNDDDILGWLGIVAAQSGDSEAAVHYSAMLRDVENSYLRGWFSFYRAAIAAHLGRPDEALSLLRGAFSRGFPWSVDLHSSLELKPLRGHPEFEAILHPEE